MKVTINERTKEVRCPRVGEVVRTKDGFLYTVIELSDNSYGYLDMDNFSVNMETYDSLEQLYAHNPDDEIVKCELTVNLR